jgi:hypothetical protein
VEGKSLCDTVMVAEGVDLLWTLQPDVLVLVTSDKDLIPLARVARQRGASVVVIGSDLTAVQLVEMCNVLITYRQLLKDLGKSPDAAPPSTPSRGTRERGRGISDRASQERERSTERTSDRRPRDRDRDRDAVPVAALPSAEEDTFGATEIPSDDVSRGDELGAEETTARRRRRRRGGRSRTDEVNAEGAPIASVDDDGAASVTSNGNGRDLDASAYLPTAELSESPAVDGRVDEAPVSELAADDAPAPRPRRRRRTTAATAVADAPTETTSSES